MHTRLSAGKRRTSNIEHPTSNWNSGSSTFDVGRWAFDVCCHFAHAQSAKQAPDWNSVFASQRLLVRAGVGVAFAFVLFRTVMVASPVVGVGGFSGDFFVLGQIKRHGCVFTVSLNSAMLRPTGSRSRRVDLNFSEDSRKFCRVTSILRFLERSLLIFWMLSSD
jgi:hypothetical protein